MKRIIYFLLALFVVSCSIDRQEETVAIEGLDGTTTLARTFNFEGAEGICENGGLRIDFGQDANGDGILQDEEIGSTNYVCNGLDGRDGNSTLIRIVAVDGTEECPNGGIAASTGFDINGNGVLDDAEISNTVFVCNGENGVDGENGLSALVNTLTIEEGDLCEEGGFVFQSGLDLNRNGTLDSNEIIQEETICNGEDGLSVVYETTNVEETENCPFGGVIIEAGLDRNENGELDQDEVATSDFICNGRDGQDGEDGFNSLVLTVSDENGVTIMTGLDLNRNNILDAEEVTSTTRVENGEDGADGEDGFNSLVKLDQINPSNTFPNGAVKISTGLDLNRNNTLDDNEISNIAFVANGENGADGQDGQDGEDGEDGEDGADGSNGLNSLINILRDTPNNNSTTIQTGIDDNNNGILEDSEVDQEFVVEDGVDGEDGEDGADGEDGMDGKCSFIVVVDEPAGPNCEFGGIKVITGKDDNRNLIFDDNEIDNIEYVCEYRPCVEIVEVETVFDFEVFSEGDFVSNYGIATVYGYNSRFNHNKAMIFDSNRTPATGGDDDLTVNSGNILIISEDGDSNDPDDNATGGVFTFTFKKDVTFTAIDIIDIEGRHNNIKFYDGFGNRILKRDLIVVGDQQQGTMTFNVEHVRKVVVSICESGAIDNLKFKCLEVINNCD